MVFSVNQRKIKTNEHSLSLLLWCNILKDVISAHRHRKIQIHSKQIDKELVVQRASSIQKSFLSRHLISSFLRSAGKTGRQSILE